MIANRFIGPLLAILIQERAYGIDIAFARGQEDFLERLGGAELDPKNTQWLTNTEHQAKTAKERKERAHGRR